MFGWEFPPHITGGLGTACFGLLKPDKTWCRCHICCSQAFAMNQRRIRLLNASDLIPWIFQKKQPGILE